MEAQLTLLGSFDSELSFPRLLDVQVTYLEPMEIEVEIHHG